MTIIDDVSKAVVWLIRAGAAFRLCYCLFRMISADDDSAMYKRRAKNIIVFYIIAECVWVIKELTILYYA
jgi:hypothetical protein